MNNASKMEEERLIPFKTSLLREAKLSESTAADYVKRIVTICKQEGFTIEHLMENIERITHDYTVGEKQDLGRRSHNSYRSALLQFQKFVANEGKVNAVHTDPKYHFEINKVTGESFGTIKLYDPNGNLIDTQVTLDRQKYPSSEMARDMLVKCIKMMFDNVYTEGYSKQTDVLASLGCTMTLDGHKMIS